MTITLKIDNCDSLPDGGPLQFTARNRSFEIGREQHLDWTLPDPSRFISGHHCEVRFEKGAYWLYDVSRNGTFLNGGQSRMKSPYRIADGDRLQIGHYIINISVQGIVEDDEDEGGRVGYSAGSYSGDSIWDTGESAPEPADRRDFMPPPSRGRREADFAEQYIDLPDMRPSPGAPPTPQSPFSAPLPQPSAPQQAPQSPFGGGHPSQGGNPGYPSPPPPRQPGFQGGGESFEPPQAPRAAPPPRPMPAPAPPPPAPPPMQPQQRHPQPPAQPPASQQPSQQHAPQAGGGFIEALAAGAGVQPDMFSGRNPGELAYEVGAFMTVTVQHLASLLRARAAAKTMARSGKRTMIGASNNNPLKFIPDPHDAIDVMFAHRKPGYLDATRSIEEGFADIEKHEFATYAAMQKALARLLDDLSPDTIEAKVENSTFSSKKSRAWDLFVSRWDAKTEPYENGMLDVFLAYFGEAYDEIIKKS